MGKLFLILLVGLVVGTGVAWSQDFDYEQLRLAGENFNSIMVHPGDSRIIFAGQSGFLHRSLDGGTSWRVVLSVRGSLRNVNALGINNDNPNLIYAASDAGLFLSQDAGEHWARVFNGRRSLERQCIAIGVRGDLILVGTRSGLFISRDRGRNWSRQAGEFSGKPVFNIDFAPGMDKIIYLAAENGIFKSGDSGENWERAFLALATQDENPEASDLTEGGLAKRPKVRFVKADRSILSKVYLAAYKGVYQSLDQGRSWEKLTEYGLLDSRVKMLCQPESQELLALTGSGVFIMRNGRWQECLADLPDSGLNACASDCLGNIYLAGEKGLYRIKPQRGSGYAGAALTEAYLKTEPDIRKIQEAAIRYAEVSPKKISCWRKDAARKAWLPQLNIGLDRNSTDLWHWEGGSTTKSDDDILRRGKTTVDWDISLTWDLSDLIWSQEQTSIDVRSKLMVELRDDILDQVNKLYFERLRVKNELNGLAIGDRSKRFEKELKLKELAASLDALTCGYYSEQLAILSAN